MRGTGRLAGAVALISGGAGGIGAAVARRFVEEGARVVVADLDQRGAAVAGALGDAGRPCRLDVTSETSWQEAVAGTAAHFGGLTVLVNGAGVTHVGTMEEMSPADYRRVIEVNQVGTWLGMRAAAPALRAAGGGSIINVGSVMSVRGEARRSAYAASKWAVVGMTKCAALELALDGIRVNAVVPGAIRTALSTVSEADLADQPVPGYGSPDEVAGIAAFLASAEARFCTGGEYVIDGGRTLS